MNSERTERPHNFILQAGILAAAGIVVRIIGLLYRGPLTAIIGDEGNGYYSFAYNMYANILLISSYSIPSAIAKIISQKMAKREFVNAHRIFKCAFVYVTIVGGAASAFAYFAAGLLVVDNAVPVLRIFAPTIFLSGFLGVFRGYYQAHKSMVPTSISQILEQIMNAAVSIGAALFFINRAGNVDETTKAIKGASGSALGTGMGVLTALIFMLLIIFLNKDKIKQNVARDITGKVDSYATITKDILFIVTPFILSTFIYNCGTAINQTIYAKTMLHVHDMTQSETSIFYGVYSGKAVVMRNIPVALASAMSSAIIPTVAESWVLKDHKGSRHKVNKAIHVTMLVAIPCVAGFIFLARPIMQVLFPQKSTLDLASRVLMGLSVTIVFYCLSTITNGVLQSIGQVNKPVTHAAIALAIQSAVLVLLIRYTNLNLYALVIADILYSFLMCYLNQISLARYMKYNQEIIYCFILPSICSLIMGAFALGTYTLSYHFIASNIICLFIAIVFSAIIYLALLLLTRTLKEEDLRSIPKGHLIYKFAKKFRLISDSPRFDLGEVLYDLIYTKRDNNKRHRSKSRRRR